MKTAQPGHTENGLSGVNVVRKKAAPDIPKLVWSLASSTWWSTSVVGMTGLVHGDTYLHLDGASQFQLKRMECVQNSFRVRTDVYFQLYQQQGQTK